MVIIYDQTGKIKYACEHNRGLQVIQKNYPDCETIEFETNLTLEEVSAGRWNTETNQLEETQGGML